MMVGVERLAQRQTQDSLVGTKKILHRRSQRTQRDILAHPRCRRNLICRSHSEVSRIRARVPGRSLVHAGHRLEAYATFGTAFIQHPILHSILSLPACERIFMEMVGSQHLGQESVFWGKQVGEQKNRSEDKDDTGAGGQIQPE